MNDAELCRRLEAAALSVEGGQWAIAELAAECEEARFPGWARKIGEHAAVRRSENTVRDWCRTAKLRALWNVPGANFGMYRRCIPYMVRLDVDDVRHMLETAVEHGATCETLSGNLAALAGSNTPPAEYELPVSNDYDRQRVVYLGERLPGAVSVRVRRA